MRYLPLIVVLSACSVESSRTPSPPATVEMEPQVAKFVIGTRTVTDGPLEHRYEDGTELVVESWTVVMSAVELHLCETSWWRRALVGDAWAHVSDSTTRLGTPVAEDVTRGTGGARIVGEVAPPRGVYCRAYAVFTPADDDVMNYAMVSQAEVEGHTALVRGHVKASGGEPVPFEWSWDGVKAVSIALDGVEMQSDTAQFQLLVDKRVDSGLLGGLNVERVRDGSAVEDLMAAFFERVTLYETNR